MSFSLSGVEVVLLHLQVPRQVSFNSGFWEEKEETTNLHRDNRTQECRGPCFGTIRTSVPVFVGTYLSDSTPLPLA